MSHDIVYTVILFIMNTECMKTLTIWSITWLKVIGLRGVFFSIELADTQNVVN